MNIPTKNLYEILEIKTECTNADIKSAFLKKSKELHPDKNQNSSTDQIQQIIEAKNILLDPELRKIYDSRGYESVKFHMHSASKFKSDNQKTAARDHPNSSYENVFLNYECSLKDMYMGIERTVNYEIKSFCRKCQETENAKIEKNKEQTKCEKCGGNGKIADRLCRECRGNGYIYCLECKDTHFIAKKQQKTIQIFNAEDGETLIEKGFGNEMVTKRTDLVIVVDVKKDINFRKFKNDIVMKMEINLYDALFGFQRVIKYIDDNKYLIQFENDVINPGDSRVVKGLGLRCQKSFLRGDLVILFDIKMPSNPPDAKIQNMLSYMMPKTLNSKFEPDASIIEMKPL